LRARGAIQADACTRARAKLHQRRELGVVCSRVAGRQYELDDILLERARHVHRENLAPRVEHLLLRRDRFRRGASRCALAGRNAPSLFARELQDRVLGMWRRVADLDMQQEPVELCFGERIRAVVLDRVLRRHHHEELGQRECRAADADLPLLHRFEQRGLHLRRRTIDLVGEHEVAKQRPRAEFERAGLCAEHFGASDVGRQQVGRELDAVKVGFEQLGERLDRGGLRKAGDAFDEDVSVAEQRDQQPLGQRELADDARIERRRDRGEHFTRRSLRQVRRRRRIAQHAAGALLAITVTQPRAANKRLGAIIKQRGVQARHRRCDSAFRGPETPPTRLRARSRRARRRQPGNRPA
jgi:hypothetical protein